MDCEALSPNARKIFDKIKEHYPPDPWNNPQWTEDGTVYANGWCDLRRGEVRSRLIERYERLIGHATVAWAKVVKAENKEIRESVFDFKLSQKWIELAVLLHELDFQIETLDLTG